MLTSYFRSHAPLRLGLAGGGTDTSPYADLFGGAVLNATINLYAHATLEPRTDGQVLIDAFDAGVSEAFVVGESPVADGPLPLLRGLCSRMLADHPGAACGFRLTTAADAPPGSGLGASSTLAVAVIGAFAQWLRLPLGEYDVARLAYDVERVEVGMVGGRQDQYAATFGGVNFMEFSAHGRVVVNPLNVRRDVLHELAHNLLLYFTEIRRDTSRIIELQTHNVTSRDAGSLRGMDELKAQAWRMKDALVLGNLDDLGRIFDFGWQAKKCLAAGITNPQLDRIYETALSAGATGGKISGAGGGGVMALYCPGNTRHHVQRRIESDFGGRFQSYQFTSHGQYAWATSHTPPAPR